MALSSHVQECVHCPETCNYAIDSFNVSLSHDHNRQTTEQEHCQRSERQEQLTYTR